MQDQTKRHVFDLVLRSKGLRSMESPHTKCDAQNRFHRTRFLLINTTTAIKPSNLFTVLAYYHSNPPQYQSPISFLIPTLDLALNPHYHYINNPYFPKLNVNPPPITIYFLAFPN